MIFIKIIIILTLFVYLFVFLGRFLLHLFFRRFQNGNNQFTKQGHTTTKDGSVYYQNQPKKKKHFKPTDGEYVDFEEIK